VGVGQRISISFYVFRNGGSGEMHE